MESNDGTVENEELKDTPTQPDVEELIETDEDDTLPANNQQMEEFRQKAIEAAGKLINLLTNLNKTVGRIDMALREELFKSFSKEMRNELMAEVLEDSRDIESVARVLFRNLKKVKKVNMSNEEKDVLINKYLVAKQNVDDQD